MSFTFGYAYDLFVLFICLFSDFVCFACWLFSWFDFVCLFSCVLFAFNLCWFCVDLVWIGFVWFDYLLLIAWFDCGLAGVVCVLLWLVVCFEVFTVTVCLAVWFGLILASCLWLCILLCFKFCCGLNARRCSLVFCCGDFVWFWWLVVV